MKAIIISTLALAGIATAQNAGDRIVIKAPFGQHKAAASGSNQILYHGGPILGVSAVQQQGINTAEIPIYVIYYGSNFPITTQPIINAFISGLGGTPNFGVNTTYCEAPTTTCSGSGTSVSGMLSFDGTLQDPALQGNTVNGHTVTRVLQYALTTGGLPQNDAAIYVLITDPTIKVPGFPTSFCAYHTHSTTVVAGHDIKYAFAPEPAALGGCDGNFANGQTVTPNGDQGADEIVDSLMHEFSETVTDPDISAWYTANGQESGDLCNYVYGTWSTLPSSPTTGASYNASWNGYYWLIQWIWLNKPLPQYCSAAP